MQFLKWWEPKYGSRNDPRTSLRTRQLSTFQTLQPPPQPDELHLQGLEDAAYGGYACSVMQKTPFALIWGLLIFSEAMIQPSLCSEL